MTTHEVHRIRNPGLHPDSKLYRNFNQAPAFCKFYNPHNTHRRVQACAAAPHGSGVPAAGRPRPAPACLCGESVAPPPCSALPGARGYPPPARADLHAETPPAGAV